MHPTEYLRVDGRKARDQYNTQYTQRMCTLQPHQIHRLATRRHTSPRMPRYKHLPHAPTSSLHLPHTHYCALYLPARARKKSSHLVTHSYLHPSIYLLIPDRLRSTTVVIECCTRLLPSIACTVLHRSGCGVTRADCFRLACRT